MAVKEYPYPPRMMTRDRAAHYCDVSISEFERMVNDGTLPLPVSGFGKREHWDRLKLDDALGVLSGERQSDWRHKSKLHGRAA